MSTYALDKDGRLPMSNKEYHSFQMLCGFADTLEQETGRLEYRAKLAGNGTLRDLRMMKTISSKVCNALFATLPRAKQGIVQAELERSTAAVIVSPPNRLPQHSTPDYTTVPTEALEWLIGQTLQWECLVCQKEGPEQKHCEFRQRLDNLHVFDIHALKKGECPYQTMERYSG